MKMFTRTSGRDKETINMAQTGAENKSRHRGTDHVWDTGQRGQGISPSKGRTGAESRRICEGSPGISSHGPRLLQVCD